MNPALSVVLFTMLSGAGYGLWFWWVLGGFGLGLSSAGLEGIVAWLLAAAIGFVLVTVGLMSSVFHLGKPARAWRAFSQWRTSWLSREGVASLLTYAVFAGCFLAMRFGSSLAIRIAGVGVAVCSLGTVFCTAMIYAGLKTVPAWSHRLVVPAYQVFALHTGGLLYLALCAIGGGMTKPSVEALAILATSSLTAAAIKGCYWHGIDRIALPSREAATALEGFGKVATFERPHTEANYLIREMGFVLARKHSRKLRSIAVLLFTGVPLLALAMAWWLPGVAVPALWIAALAALAGAFVERWLFFAEAKHMVMLYY